MCIIVYKPNEIELPSEEILENCFRGNSDGAGFAFQRPNENLITVRKGYMKFSAFLKEYKSYNLTKEDKILFHFRIATAGKVNSANTHPFPLSQEIEHLKTRNFKSWGIMAHNGILGNGDVQNDLSDSQLFIRKALTINPDTFKELKNKGDKSIVSHYLEYLSRFNRFIIMFANGKVFKWGEWIESKGIFYSNSSFKREKYYFVKNDINKKHNYKRKKDSWDYIESGYKDEIDSRKYTGISTDVIDPHQEENKAKLYNYACSKCGGNNLSRRCDFYDAKVGIWSVEAFCKDCKQYYPLVEKPEEKYAKKSSVFLGNCPNCKNKIYPSDYICNLGKRRIRIKCNHCKSYISMDVEKETAKYLLKLYYM